MSRGDDGAPAAAAAAAADVTSRLAVPPSVGRRFFHDRLSDQYAHHYHLIVSIFKGVSLYSAAVSFLAISASQEPGVAKVAAMALWVASLAAIMATYDGIMVTSIVASAPPNAVDLVAPFVMGLAEYVQFAVLIPLGPGPGGAEPSVAAQLEHITWWPLVFAVLALTGAIDIANARAQMAKGLSRAPAHLQPLLEWYAASLRQSQISTMASSGAALAAFLLLHFGPAGIRHWQAVLAVAVFVGMVNGIVISERARHRIVASVAAVVRRAPAAEG